MATNTKFSPVDSYVTCVLLADWESAEAFLDLDLLLCWAYWHNTYYMIPVIHIGYLLGLMTKFESSI